MTDENGEGTESADQFRVDDLRVPEVARSGALSLINQTSGRQAWRPDVQRT
jgi:hypothetical protein